MALDDSGGGGGLPKMMDDDDGLKKGWGRRVPKYFQYLDKMLEFFQ